MENRNWRDAKIPNWVKDSIADEFAALKLTAALAWPTQAKPEPVPFRWGEYDRVIGEPHPGTYWQARWNSYGGSVDKVRIKKNDGSRPSWKAWAFSGDGENWHTSIPRGHLFATEDDARLSPLWLACEDCAQKLMKLREAR